MFFPLTEAFTSECEIVLFRLRSAASRLTTLWIFTESVLRWWPFPSFFPTAGGGVIDQQPFISHWRRAAGFPRSCSPPSERSLSTWGLFEVKASLISTKYISDPLRGSCSIMLMCVCSLCAFKARFEHFLFPPEAREHRRSHELQRQRWTLIWVPAERKRERHTAIYNYTKAQTKFVSRWSGVLSLSLCVFQRCAAESDASQFEASKLPQWLIFSL